jgi:hypothetical protein
MGQSKFKGELVPRDMMKGPYDVLPDLLHQIQTAHLNHDITRAGAEAELEHLLSNILSVGIVALSEQDAIEAYSAGAKAMDRVLDRIARDADSAAKRAKRSRRPR